MQTKENSRRSLLCVWSPYHRALEDYAQDRGCSKAQVDLIRIMDEGIILEILTGEWPPHVTEEAIKVVIDNDLDGPDWP